MTEKKLQPLKRKLKSDENFHRKFKDFVIKGYARKLTAKEAKRRSRKVWYLPHHGVFRPNKKDKIRVVFDAAA